MRVLEEEVPALAVDVASTADDVEGTHDSTPLADAAADLSGVTSDVEEYQYVLKGASSLLDNIRGGRRVYSPPFQLGGHIWHLDIDAQAKGSFVQPRTETAKVIAVYLTLRDAAVLPPGDMPYVACRVSALNHATGTDDILTVMQKQYRSGLNKNGMLNSWRAGFIRHTHLRAQAKELMPDGDLHLRLRLDRLVPARDTAISRGCTVGEYLAVAAPNVSEGKGDIQKEADRKKAADWLVGGDGKGASAKHKNLNAGAAAVCSAVEDNAALCKRIRATWFVAHYGGPDGEFDTTLRALRNTLGCKLATDALLTHFGGDKPHAAVVACLVADPAGLLRHISAAVAPQHTACGDDFAKPTALPLPPRRGMRAVLLRALLCGEPKVEKV
eukprot:jgi/Ulvmu1/1051/UM105_0007.1